MSNAPIEGVLRAGRGAVVGGLAVVVSQISHVTAAGSTPSALVVFALIAVATLIGVSCAGRQFGFGRATLVVGATQPLLHVIATDSASAGHHMDTAVSAASHQVTAGMLLAHVVATVVAAALLSTLDTALWRWLRYQFTRVATMVWPDLAAPTTTRSAIEHDVRVVRSVWLFSAPWRGPPAGDKLAAPA